MAPLTLFTHWASDKFMREVTDGSKCHHAIVVAVASDTILFDQFLMKGHVLFLAADGLTLGGPNTYLSHLMAAYTLLQCATDEGCMAGKAVGCDLSMGRYGLARTDHEMGHRDGQGDQNHQVQ
jgi:hypothetical protein